MMSDLVSSFHEQVTALKVGVTEIAAARAMKALSENEALTMEQFAILIREMDSRFGDELSTKHLYVLDDNRAKFFTPNEPLFGSLVFDKLEKSRRDIEEAGKCYALARNKAMVFHLMLAMEEALRALATKIGAAVYDHARDQFYPWGAIVGNVKDKIPTLPKAQQNAWTEAHNLLWGVGKAWRNPTMHPADVYTDEEAKRVFEAVDGFMRHLARLV